MSGTRYVRQCLGNAKSEYTYIWCFVANFHFKFIFTNAITQCEQTLRPEKLWEKTVADPGFPLRGVDLVGGRRGLPAHAPPRSANGKRVNSANFIDSNSALQKGSLYCDGDALSIVDC